jgi:prepilin-type N-terminal cleavage/methylation domain-containing protein
MLRRNDGFTLIELLVVIAIIGILIGNVFNIGIIVCGNFWYSEDDVLRELKADHQNVTEILKTKRSPCPGRKKILSRAFIWS